MRFTPAGELTIHKGGAICFEREKDGGVREEVLFFGPYFWLHAGAYSFALEGEISGTLDLALTAEQGKETCARHRVQASRSP